MCLAHRSYQLHAGIYRRICSNGLVVSEGSFEAIRFRHSKLDPDEVVRASFRLLEFVPKVGEMVNRFRERVLNAHESLELARHAVLLRYPSLHASPVEPETLLKPRRYEDAGVDLWTTMNRIQENLIRGGVSDSRRGRRGRVRSVRALRGIDSKISPDRASSLFACPVKALGKIAACAVQERRHPQLVRNRAQIGPMNQAGIQPVGRLNHVALTQFARDH